MSSNPHLDQLEEEAIFIIREVIATCERPAVLFSGGKDSMVLLHLACKAFRINGISLPLPFEAVHIDTGHNYQEVLDFRDDVVKKYGVKMVIGSVEESIAKGSVRLSSPTASRNSAQSVTLLEAIEQHRWTALMGGARRDEERARAKERIFSFRDEFGGWNPKDQRPELWSLYNTHIKNGEHLRVFPISNFTELDIWEYIKRETLPLPTIYYAHRRQVVRRGDTIIPVNDLMPIKAGEQMETLSVRFRTVGDRSITCPVLSQADSIDKIIIETHGTTL
ncbi:MAG: sulfate adenylyltransferase subunit 2, partial [Alphaproteobacteria bacterium]|nr:sulfate adenylyltransferase subunit 2 [Alphaproteobacteria bacterium]